MSLVLQNLATSLTLLVLLSCSNSGTTLKNFSSHYNLFLFKKGALDKSMCLPWPHFLCCDWQGLDLVISKVPYDVF